mgnify:CR=1 FL=1
MVVTTDSLAQIISEQEEDNYPFVFTEARRENGGIVYNAVIGEKLHVDPVMKTVRALEGELSTGGLYIISISSYSLSSRVYGGIVGFENSNNIYFSVVFPDWHILDKLQPVVRWRFRYISFEYPRRGKKGFLLPTINIFPFAYCFITESDREMIEHLCPPVPIARYMPEEFGYDKEELTRYLNSTEQKQKHANELYPAIHNFFQRSKGDINHYIPMDKQLIPEEYRDYQMLYNADGLWDW